MGRKTTVRLVVVGVLAVALGGSSPVFAGYYGFDDIPATGAYADVTPGGPRGPAVVGPGVTFDGGVIMSDDGWAGLATSKPNLYGTCDFFPLADGSLLPGMITGTFAVPTTSVMLDVINGTAASTFTLSAFDASDVLLDSDSVALGDYPGASPASLSVSGSGIAYFTVTSAQPVGGIDFAIDSVEFTESGVVPVPGAMILAGLGGCLTGWLRRRRML